MQIPGKLPGLKLATLLLGAYGALWISLEGNLLRAVLMGTSVAVISTAHLFQKHAGGQKITLGRWLLMMAAMGLLVGLSSALLTLVFMAVKTGLHAHGPEFTMEETGWVALQIPLWSLAGVTAGLGMGLVSYKSTKE
jgi:hypothetical protein